MPTYFPIKRWMDAAEKARTAERLIALRQKLKSEITDRAGAKFAFDSHVELARF